MSRKNSSKITGKTHASWVTSRIASSDKEGTPLHAAMAEIVVANSNGSHFESTNEYKKAIENLVGEGVRLINESFSTDVNQLYNEWHQIRDDIARTNGVLFVRSAGNNDGSTSSLDVGDPGPDENVEQVLCQSQNTLCVGGSNESSSYGDITDDTMWFGSRWANPGDSFEISEPDVTSQATGAKIMRTNDLNGFFGGVGTSFAAPTITGLIALDIGSCGPFSPKRYRAVTQNAAYIDQDLEKDAWPVYPTFPSEVFFSWSGEEDWFGGAGIPEAARLADYCGGGGNGDNPFEDPVPGASSTDGSWGGSGMTGTPPHIGDPSPEETNEENLKTEESALKWSDSVHKVLYQFDDPLNAGQDIRFTMSWNNCPDDDSRVPAKDYDLAMCGERIDLSTGNSEATCKAYSESLHDTDEGLEVEIEDGFRWEEVKFHALSAKGDRGCNGEPEPLHWAVAWGALN